VFSGAAIVYGLEIVLLPITFFELQGANFVQSTFERDITSDIENRLNRYYNIRVSTLSFVDHRAGATQLDAHQAAARYQINEVLFGTMRDNGSSLVVELNIYNRRSETVIGQIFASDSKIMYERLINTLIRNILDWYDTNVDKVDLLLDEVHNLRTEIDSLRENLVENARVRSEEMEEVEKAFILRVPVMLGHWSYVERSWSEMVQGTVEFSTGIQMFPKLQFSKIFDMNNELSIGLRVGYRNGITGNKESVLMNGLLLNPLIGYHINFYTENWLCLGVGTFFEYGMWEIEALDYLETQSYTQILTGYTINLDYSYRFNSMFAVNFGADFYGYFARGTSSVIRTYFGISTTVFGGRSEI
jgi:TolB-like protein